MSTKVYFILSGTVHICDTELKMTYGKLEKGAIFGDISLMMQQPNKYSYVFSQNQDDNLFMVSVDSLRFVDMCAKDQLARSILHTRTNMKNVYFESYKKLIL